MAARGAGPFGIFAAAVALLVVAGEVARWWGNPRLIPLAFDELLIGAVLLSGVLARRPLLLLTGWALLAGHTLALLVPTLDHLMSGPPKESASFYAAVLGGMFAVECAAIFWSARLLKRASRRY